jgi:hypothetical protein
MQQRVEQGRGRALTVWAFRVGQSDPEGKPAAPVPVEMRARSFEGSINNGDWVELEGNWRSGEIVHVRQVRNLSLGAVVKARGNSWARVEDVSRFLLMIIALAVIGVIALTILNSEQLHVIRTLGGNLIRVR